MEHFIIFAANGFAFGLYSRRPSLIMVALVIFAGAIELVQVLVPGRRARLSDFIIDALAMCIGVAAASIVATRTLERGV